MTLTNITHSLMSRIEDMIEDETDPETKLKLRRFKKGMQVRVSRLAFDMRAPDTSG